jgi:hypothetical protein
VRASARRLLSPRQHPTVSPMLVLRRSCIVVVLCCVTALMAACARQEPIATLQTKTGTISLLHLRDGGGFVVNVSPHTVLPLSSYTSARIESTWDTASGRLIVIAGAGKNCPERHSLVVVTAAAAKIVPMGECGGTYNFLQGGETITIRQSNAREVKLWIFTHGSLHGPTLEHAHTVPSRHVAQARPVDNANSPTMPPPISTPVGDEVIPPPVTGASLSGTEPHDAPHL